MKFNWKAARNTALELAALVGTTLAIKWVFVAHPGWATFCLVFALSSAHAIGRIRG